VLVCRTLAFIAILLVPAVGYADARVLARLPRERRAEMMAALRVELAGRGTLVEGEALGDDATDAAVRADAGDATHIVWVVFPGGLLAPPEVRVLDVTRSSAARAMAPQAWDVVEPRVVAVVAASLLDASEAPGAASTAEAAPEVAPTDLAPDEPTPTAPGVPALVTPEPLALAPPARVARPARRFSLWLGVGVAHSRQPWRLVPEDVGATTQLAFYARMSEWASLGLRLRAWFGFSSIEGAGVLGSIGLPSILVGFRESLGTAAAIELGVHAEGYLSLDWAENRHSGADRLSFGLGAGAFVALELGRANGLALDYTIEIYGLGGTETWSFGSATLSYVHRWE
jgi:hypothetical protein